MCLHLPLGRYSYGLKGMLSADSAHKGLRALLAIDLCFRTLASEFQNRAVAVILSGTGSDGSLGLREIKEKGGITFVQDEQSSKFHSMPQSAITTGAVDFILPPNEIAAHLEKVARHEYVKCEPEAL